MVKVLLLKNGEFKVLTYCGEIVELKVMQDNVGGYIELFPVDKFLSKGIDVFVNEEGKLMELIPSVIVLSSIGEVVELLAGNVLFAGRDDDGNTIGLSDENIEFIRQEMKNKRTVSIGVNHAIYEVAELVWA